MKRGVLFLILVSITFIVYSQSNSKYDSTGVFLWQYHRSIYKNSLDSNSAIVTVVFINGSSQAAISYRQEDPDKLITWLDKDGGTITRDGYVEVITYNLEPNKAILFTYRITKVINENVKVEKSALLIMDQNFQVIKENFSEQIVN